MMIRLIILLAAVTLDKQAHNSSLVLRYYATYIYHNVTKSYTVSSLKENHPIIIFIHLSIYHHPRQRPL
jgi:hypothetical protein